MDDFLRNGSHCVYNIQYHFVWSTKYRKQLFFGDEAIKIRTCIKNVCRELKIEIVQGNIKKDCIDLVVSAPPTLSVAKLVGIIKGKSAHLMFRISPHLRTVYPGGSLWAAGYFVSTNIHATKTNYTHMEVSDENDPE